MAKSNLGAYQTMVELAKSADGPVKLGLYVAAGGILVGGTAVAVAGPTIVKGTRRALEAVKQKIAPSRTPNTKIFSIHSPADGGKGLLLEVGDRFTVENEIEGGALIDVRGKKRNPWMVSSQLLENISNYVIRDSSL